MAKSPTKSDTAPTPAKAAAKPKTKPAKVDKVAKEALAKKPKDAIAPAVKKSAKKLKDQSPTILQLAADVIADRVIPTIEQIKSIALSAINHETAKDKPKTKKKK